MGSRVLLLNGDSKYDIVIGADVTYNDDPEPLISTMWELAHCQTHVFLSHEPRSHVPRDGIDLTLRAHFRTVTCTTVQLDAKETSSGERSEIVLWRCIGALDR